MDEKRWNERKLENMIEGWKNKGLSKEDIKEGDERQLGKGRGSEIYKEYKERLRKMKECDFGDIMMNKIRILRKKKDIMREYNEKLR